MRKNTFSSLTRPLLLCYQVPVPLDGSVKFVNYKFEGKKSEWLDYNAERKGRFVGLANKDGSTKTECGIHVAGAEQTFDRDLWVDGSKVDTRFNPISCDGNPRSFKTP